MLYILTGYGSIDLFFVIVIADEMNTGLSKVKQTGQRSNPLVQHLVTGRESK